MKKIKLFAMAALVMAAATFILTSENLVKADVAEDIVIKEGVYIGGVNVGGMTAEEATTAVDTYVAGLQEQWITLVGPKDNLKYQLKDFGLSAKTSVAVQEAVAIGNTGNMIKRFKVLQDLEKEDHVIDMGLSIDKQGIANKIYAKRSKVDIKAMDNGLKKENGKFVYVPGQAGNEVDIVTSVNKLNEYIGSDWELAVVENAEFKLDSIVSEPRGTEEQLASVKDLLGAFTTNYGFSDASRRVNVENGVSKINGTIMYPGDSFSFYEYVTPFTKENGYEVSFSFENGNTVTSVGGGICQVVTTLYNALLNAELDITQRFAHSMVVGYVDPGADAAIAGTYKDLRFVNNYDFPIYIDAYCSNDNIYINIYGDETRPSNRKVTYESEIISENDPPTEFTLSADYPLGGFYETRGKHIGYVAKLWKVVKVDGVEKERKQMNKSTYVASCRKVIIGTAGATAEQLAAIREALATQDDEYIQSVVVGFVTPPEPEKPATPETPSKPEGGDTTPETGEGTGSESNKGDENETPETDANENEESDNNGN